MNHANEYHKSRVAKQERRSIPIDVFYHRLKKDEWLAAGIDRGDGEKLIDGHMKKVREEEEKKHKEHVEEEEKKRKKDQDHLWKSIHKEFKNPDIDKREPGKDPEVLNQLAKHKDPHKKKRELLRLQQQFPHDWVI